MSSELQLGKNFKMTSGDNINLLLVLSGNLISSLGDYIYLISLTWYLLSMNSGGKILGIVLTIASIPQLLIGPFAGVIADRYNRKTLIITMDIVRGILMFVMAALLFNNMLNIICIYAITLILEICSCIFNPSIIAIIANIVSSDKLQKANSMNQMIFSASAIIGPAIGGIIFGKYGFMIVLIIDGISYLFSAFSEAFIKVRSGLKVKSENNEEDEDNKQSLNFLKEIKAGLKTMMRINVIKYIIIFAVAVNFFIIPIFEIIIPYAFEHVLKFSSSKYGVNSAARAFGTILGSMMLFALPEFKKKSKLLIFVAIAVAIMFIGFGFSLTPQIIQSVTGDVLFYFYCIGSFIIGGLLICVNIPIDVAIQRFVPDEQLGTVFSLMTVFFRMVAPATLFIYGFLIEKIQTSSMVIVSGAMVIILTILISLSAKFREI